MGTRRCDSRIGSRANGSLRTDYGLQSSQIHWFCDIRKLTPRCSRSKRKVLSCAANFIPTPPSKNGAIADCWREFIGSRSIDCARKFSRSRFRISIVFFSRGSEPIQEHRVEGLEGLQSVLEQLDGCELPLAAWESAVLPARVADYDPEWLDRLCFSGRVGWGRLSAPQNSNARASAPLRTSPIALYLRENLADWLALTLPNSAIELSVTSQAVFEALQSGGALFFSELVSRSGLLPSQVEEALSQLAALGLVTSDSFDGLRALLVPSNKRPTFGRSTAKRRRKTNLASIEFAGRWSLLPRSGGASSSNRRVKRCRSARSGALEKFARVLLRRYGVVFRRLLERESFPVNWYELGRIYRRWEARGEIRGGYFVGGVSGEQFALPEAIGLLRSIRKSSSNGELITLSAADPLNLQGILTPGARIPAFTANRILFRDGLPVAALESREIRTLSDEHIPDPQIENALRIGKLRPSLRPYYK